MMKSKLLNSLVLTALAVPGVAMAADSLPVTANVSLTTNYLYRGISQTGGKPAVQGGFDYAHPSGFYAGVWGSNISWISDVAGTADAASVELDTYLGFTNSFATDFSYDVGFLRYNYPGEYTVGTTKADTNEIYGSIGWKWLKLKYSYSLGDTFGISEAKGTNYVDLSGSYTIEDIGVTVGAHYGKQTYKGATADGMVLTNQDPTYSDYNLSASKDFSGYVVGLTFSSTNAESGGWYTASFQNGSTADLGKNTVVLSVKRSM